MPMPGRATSSGRRRRLYRFSRSRRCSLESSRDSRDRASDLRQAPFAGHNDRSNEAAGTRLARPPRGFARFLYSSNPFYIVSADLVFVGLRISFGPGGPASYSWVLAIGLATYTLLLATTACFLIRVGKLWDDLRSLLLVIVMMFDGNRSDVRRLGGPACADLRVDCFTWSGSCCGGSRPCARQRFAGQARRLVAAFCHSRGHGVRCLGTRSTLPADCSRQPGLVAQLFRSAQLPAAATDSQWPRSDRLRALVFRDRGRDQLQEGGPLAATGRRNHVLDSSSVKLSATTIMNGDVSAVR